MRGYADVMPLGGSLTPLRGSDSISWTAKYRNGEIKRFKFPIRTTDWGSIDPFKDTPDASELNTQGLVGETRFLGIDTLPTVSTR